MEVTPDSSAIKMLKALLFVGIVLFLLGESLHYLVRFAR